MNFFEEYDNFDNKNDFDESNVENIINSAREMVESGDVLFNLNFIEEAIHLCMDYDYPEDGIFLVDAVIETITYNSDFWQYKGIFHNALGEYEEAFIAFEKSLELNPGDTETLLNFAATHENLGDITTAVNLLEKAIEIEPTNIDALMGLAVVNERKGNYDKAIEYFERVLSIDEEYSEAWYELGFSLENAGRLEDSEQAYKRYIDLEPESYYGWYNRGIVLLQLGNFKDAVDHFEFASVLNKNFSSSFFNLGIANLTIGKYEDAAEAFEKTVKIDKKDYSAWYYLGKSYLSLKNFGQAISALDKAIKIQPDFNEAYIERAKAKEKTGDMYGALADFNKALLVTVREEKDEEIEETNNSDTPLSGILRGIDTELSEGNLNSALNLIGFFESLYPDTPEILLRKSLIFFEFGDLKEGINSLKEALKLNSNLLNKFNRTFAAMKDSELIKKIIDNK